MAYLLPGRFTSSYITSRSLRTSVIVKRYFQRPPTYKEQIDQGVPFGKRKVYGKERQSVLQVVAGMTIFAGFVAAPLVGKKLAYRDSEVLKWVPWGDFTVNRHYKGVETIHSREDIHRSLLAYQKEMHERAIKGEFSGKSDRDDKGKGRSVYWRPSLSDGPSDPDDDDDEDDEY